MSADYDKAIKMNSDNRSAEMGLYPAIAGDVTLDEPIGYLAKYIMNTASGGILVRGKNGRNQWIPYVAANQLFPFQFDMVLTSGDDWQGTARTTTSGTISFLSAE